MTGEMPSRKPTRLRGYDYGAVGYYFVTICTYGRKEILSRIVGQGLAPAESRLTAYGEIVAEELLNLERRYTNIRIDKYVIMPNHIHAIIEITPSAAGASPCPTLSQAVGAFKSIAVRRCRKIFPQENIFQSSFHDHIIRGEEDYRQIWEYVDENPARWEDDCFYVPAENC